MTSSGAPSRRTAPCGGRRCRTCRAAGQPPADRSFERGGIDGRGGGGGVAGGLGDHVGDRAGPDHVAGGELGGERDVGRLAGRRAVRGEAGGPRALAIVEVGARQRRDEHGPAQLEVAAAPGLAGEEDAGGVRDGVEVLGGEVAAIVVERLGVGEEGGTASRRRAAARRGREHGRLRAVLEREHRGHRDHEQRAAERAGEPGGRGAPAGAARAGEHDADAGASGRRTGGGEPRHERVERRARGVGQEDAELGVGRDQLEQAGERGCSASSPRSQMAGLVSSSSAASLVALDGDDAAAPQRRAGGGRGEQAGGRSLQNVGDRLEVEGRLPAGREGVEQLARVEVEGRRWRRGGCPLASGSRPSRCAITASRVAPTGARARSRSGDDSLDLGRRLARAARPQRAAGEPLHRRRVAQVDLRGHARIGEAGAGVEPPHERRLGVQAHAGDRRVELTQTDGSTRAADPDPDRPRASTPAAAPRGARAPRAWTARRRLGARLPVERRGRRRGRPGARAPRASMARAAPSAAPPP